MMRIALVALGLALSLGWAPAFAQSSAQPVITGYLSMTGCSPNPAPCFIQYGSGGGSGSNASGGIGSNPFTQQGNNVPISATTTSTNAAITAATTMLVTNPAGGSTVYCAPETTSGGTVTTLTGTPVPAGASQFLSQAQDAFVACITASGTASVTISPGITALDGATPVQSSGLSVPMVQADTTFNSTITTATTTKLISGAANKVTYIGHLVISVSGADTLTLEYGTTTTNPCDTGTTAMSAPYQLAVAGAGSVEGGGVGYVRRAPAGKDVCAVTTTTATLGVDGLYTQQ